MKRISARFIVSKTQEWLWNNLFGPFVLVFDDGEEIVTNAKETLFSGYGWEYHRLYPETPLLAKHHLQTILGGKFANADTHLELLSVCLRSTYDAYCLPNFQARQLTYNAETQMVTENVVSEIAFREHLSELAYRFTNTIYNELSHHCEEYVVSLNILDFMEVLAHPTVRQINNTLEGTPQSINNAYKVVRNTLRDAPELQQNPLAKAVHSKTVKVDQLMQCITARGPLTDTDSYMFKHPILRGYARGLRSLHDLMIESRSAAKSLASSKAQLQDAEYFSRRLQLVNQIVQNLHMGDCGSTEFLHWLVRPEVTVGGRVKSKSDLETLEGKYYLDDDGVMKMVKVTDKHLLNRTLRLRSVLHCRHPDPYGVCSTCFGDLSYSVPRNSNIGHMCCTHVTQKSSQSVLSLKHLDMNSQVDGVIIDSYMRRFLRAALDQNSYIVAPELKEADQVRLIIAPAQARGMTDVRDVEDVETLPLSHVSEMDSITILVTTGPMTEPVTLPVRLNNRSASLTYEMLEYIKLYGVTLDPNGNYSIDLATWDWQQPILTLPPKHYNMSDHSAAIAKMLESTVKEKDERDTETNPSVFLKEFHDLVNDKLNVNLAVNEIVVYGVSIRSAANYDYRLPKPGTEYGLGVRSNIMMYRSAPAAMAFQGHREFFLSPSSYTCKVRPDHPLDGILMPAEKLKEEQAALKRNR